MQMKLVEALKDSCKAGSVKAIVFDKNKDFLDCIKKALLLRRLTMIPSLRVIILSYLCTTI